MPSDLQTEMGKSLKDQGIMLLIESVAARAAKAAVKDTFHLLGVDLDNATEVSSTRDVMTSWRASLQRKQKRRDEWQTGAVRGVWAVLVAGVLGATGYLASTVKAFTAWHG